MREFNLLSIATIHHHIAPVVGVQLSALGFAVRKPLHWIRSADAPIRQLVTYAQLKGGALAPQWGFCLDFVPHLSGQGSELSLSYMWGVSGLLEQMQPRVEGAIRAATALWAKARTHAELYALVEELRSKPGSELHTQLPIANAICLARSGAKRRDCVSSSTSPTDSNSTNRAPPTFGAFSTTRSHTPTKHLPRDAQGHD